MQTSPLYLKKHKDNGRWYVHWTEGRVGKRISTGTTDLAEAEKFRASYVKIASDNPAAADAGLALGEVWQVYYEKHIQAKAAAVYSADMAWNQLRPYFAHLPATGLTQDAVDDYVAKRTSGKLGRTVKPQTCTKELTYLRSAVAFCADPRRKLIPAECSYKLTLPEQGPPRERWLRPEEIAQLLAGASTFYNGMRVFGNGPRKFDNGGKLGRGEIFIWLALYTAGREQALLDLEWENVDFDANVVHLAKRGRKKTKKSRASVPIAKELRHVLERAYRERENERVLMHGGAIWPTIQSIVMHAGLAEKQSVATSKKVKATGISPHVFRHTAATLMARRKVPMYQIAAILGNSVAMVTKVYAKHAKEDLQAAVDLI